MTKIPETTKAVTTAFRNERALVKMRVRTIELIREIDETRFDVTKLDIHELDVFLALSDLRLALSRFVAIAAEIRTLRDESVLF